MPVNKEIQQWAGATAGDVVRVTVEPDIEDRPIEVPADLATALAGAGVRPAFDALTPFRRREMVASAGKPETRARRIETTVTALARHVG